MSVDYDRDVFVTPDGRASSEIESHQSSWVKIAPSSALGGRQFFVSLSEPDLKDWVQHMHVLTGVNSIGVMGVQYRERLGGPVMPWFVELDLVPR